MNRLKLWLYTVVVVGGGFANLVIVSRELADRAMQQVDRTLQAAAAQLEARVQLRVRGAIAAAELAARDPNLLAVLGEPVDATKGRPALHKAKDAGDAAARHASLDKVGRSAIETAARTVAVDPTGGLGWAASGREGSAYDLGTDAAAAEQEIAPFLRDGAAGKGRQGHARIGNTVWYVASAPAGAGAGVAVGVPLDTAFAGEIRRATGADLTIVAGSAVLASTLATSDARAVVAARKPSARPVPVGTLGPLRPTVRLPFNAPGLKLFFVRAPAYEVVSAPVSDLPDASAVLSVSLAPSLALLATVQHFAFAGLAGLLLFAVALTIFGRGERRSAAESATEAPREPMAAPTAETAPQTEFPSTAATAEAPPDGAAGPVDGVFGPTAPRAVPIEPSPEPLPLSAPASLLREAAQPLATTPPPGISAPQPAAAAGAAALDPFASPAGGLNGAAAVARAPVPSPAVVADAAPGLAAAPSPSDVPAADDEHWRQVFQDFLKVRQDCGERAEGLSYEKFRQKLQKNRDALIQKYGCRGVRFQVYVKEGKAALKATPVR